MPEHLKNVIKTKEDMQVTCAIHGQRVDNDYQFARLHRPDSLESNFFSLFETGHELLKHPVSKLCW